VASAGAPLPAPRDAAEVIPGSASEALV